MKFGKRLLSLAVPEWQEKYLRYKRLKKQLKRARSSREEYMQAFNEVKDITGYEADVLLGVEHMEEDRKFYRLLEDDLDMVETFYHAQLEAAHKRLYELVQQLIQLEMLECYIPSEYPTLDKSHRVTFLGGSLDAVLDSDDEEGVSEDKTGRSTVQSAAKSQPVEPRTELDDRSDYNSDTDEESDGNGEEEKEEEKSGSDGDSDSDQDSSSEKYSSRSQSSRNLRDKLSLNMDLLSKMKTLSPSELDGAEETNSESTMSVAAAKLKRHQEDIAGRRLERMARYANDISKRPIKSVISSNQVFDLAKKNKGKPTSPEDEMTEAKINAIQRLLASSKDGRRRRKNRSRTQDEMPKHCLRGNEIVVFPLAAKLSKEAKKKARKTLSFAFKEYYRGLCLLDSFCRVNLEGFNNVLKKHDKLLGTTSRLDYMKQIKKQHDFVESRRLLVLQAETERIYCMCFTKGSRHDGMRKLRVPLRKKAIGWSLFRLGTASGLAIMFFAISLCLFIYMQYFASHAKPERLEDMAKVYRMIWLTVLMNWMWGLDSYIWNLFRVNYALIFKLDIRSHVRWQQLLESASIFTVIWIFSVLLYLISGVGFYPLEWMEKVPWQVFPFSLFMLLLLVIFVQQIKADGWLVRRFFRIFRAPFVPVEFTDVFFTDQLCSLVLFFQDVEFTVCYFSYDAWIDQPHVCNQMDPYVKPLIAMIPYLLRLLQCLRRYKDTKDWWNLVNAGKYASSMLVTIFSTLRTFYPSEQGWLVLWVCGVMLSTLYTYTWDLRKDWNVGHTNAKYKFLRNKLLYSKYYYYFAMVTNLIMRCSWTLSISSPQVWPVSPTTFNWVVASLEVIRRGQWNIIRLENEHLHYKEKYTATHAVPLPFATDHQFELNQFRPFLPFTASLDDSTA